MKILILVILFIIFFPIIKMWMFMRRARRNMEDAYEQLRRHSQPDASTDNGRYHDRYGDDVGEYADYEEVRGEPHLEPETEDPVAMEEQVVDAEFEEIR
ncbi:MAG: hypothetical protein J6S96_03550 [Muribaculaceae bacterium]|nr:hypothetical protein [Muribaculaceae bacterium]